MPALDGIVLGPLELDALVEGAAILGTGGGGPVMIGKALSQFVNALHQAGKQVEIVQTEAIPDDALIGVVAVIGAPDAAPNQGEQPAAPAISPGELLERIVESVAQAFQKLSDELFERHRRPLEFVLPIELGAGSTLLSLAIAAKLGKQVIDAAGADRAVPVLSALTFDAKGARNGVAISPIVLTNPLASGNPPPEVLNATDAADADAQLRGKVKGSGFGRFGGLALWAMTGAQVRQVAVPRRVTVARDLGLTLAAARRENPSGGEPLVAAVRAELGRERQVFLTFEGTVTDTCEVDKDDDGFDIGFINLSGSGTLVEPNGDEVRLQELRIEFLNESLVAYDRVDISAPSARLIARAPDLLCYLTADGTPFTNADQERNPVKDKKIVVFAVRASDAMRHPPIVAAFDEQIEKMRQRLRTPGSGPGGTACAHHVRG
jgi:DUF917 family protein